MKIAILEKCPTKNNDMSKRIDAHSRNSYILSNELKADLLLTKNDYLKNIDKSYDVVILQTNSMGIPINYIEKIISNNLNCKKIYISNEYTTLSGGIIYKHDWGIIKNYEKTNIPKNCHNLGELNINLLFSRKPNDMCKKKYDCIYYGTFRKGRIAYFKEYLQKNIYLSTGGKGKNGNFKYFKNIGCNAKNISKISWENKKETLNLFNYSLYIEDEYTHSVFNNLANRWYEAGFCNNVMFFDVNCLNTIRKSEIASYEDEIMFYVVSSHAELIEKINECNKNFEKHLNVQKHWRERELIERENMINKLKEIIYQ